jgi:bifunctional N-acetylglucosamine-1-phosphate-uridyltransferase/glucosamine-1-phosphate-acetyltransferase GlmU-like protein
MGTGEEISRDAPLSSAAKSRVVVKANLQCDNSASSDGNDVGPVDEIGNQSELGRSGNVDNTVETPPVPSGRAWIRSARHIDRLSSEF